MAGRQLSLAAEPTLASGLEAPRLAGALRPGGWGWRSRLRVRPRSLAARTAVVLLAGLATVQVAGLTIHALDRIELQRLAQRREIAGRVINIYRSVALAALEQRETVLGEFDLRDGATVRLSMTPGATGMPAMPVPIQRELRVNMQLVPMPQFQRPREMLFAGGPAFDMVGVSMRLPEGRWVDVTVPMPPPRPWHSFTFLLAFVLMTLAAALLTLWAVRRLTAPVRTLAAAAEALGRNVNASPLPEEGPLEVATAAAAFNLMAARIRRFVQDRTFTLTAIGHDLRTPITRLKLRAEFLDDDELRRKMLADLDELEAMVAATLTFGRDAASEEPVSSIDLAELVRTILDEAADTGADGTERLGYSGPDHLTVRVRPVSLKRAISNLVANAIKYGGGASVTLLAAERQPRAAGRSAGFAAPPPTVTLMVEDDGPGIPESEIERAFQPFQRLETSRNRETGGTGLGLPIARNILRAHGGDVTFCNRPQGGARATATLPA